MTCMSEEQRYSKDGRAGTPQLDRVTKGRRDRMRGSPTCGRFYKRQVTLMGMSGTYWTPSRSMKTSQERSRSSSIL